MHSSLAFYVSPNPSSLLPSSFSSLFTHATPLNIPRHHATSSKPILSNHRLRQSSPILIQATTAPSRPDSAKKEMLEANKVPSLYTASTSSGANQKTAVNKDGTPTNVAIIGGGLAGLITALELAEAGAKVTVYETRPFLGGKVGSWQDADGNHIEMGLHVFFGCYYNLFQIMVKVGSFDSLLLKQHVHTFVNKFGDVRDLDFQFGGIGAPFNGLKAFFTTPQLSTPDKLANAIALGTSPIVRGLVDFDGAMRSVRELDKVSFTDWFLSKGGSRGSIDRMWNPIAYALGFIDCDNISARCMLTIFMLFAIRSEASMLRMLEGSPDNYLTGPIVDYLKKLGVEFKLRKRVRSFLYQKNEAGELVVNGFKVSDGPQGREEDVLADIVVAACDIPGIQKLVPQDFRDKYPLFENIFKLTAVPVITVQLRFDGWVTEIKDKVKAKESKSAVGLDNLLYSADADFSCFADLALTSPSDYYKEGQGSLLQCVLTPADPYMPLSDEEITAKVLSQVHVLFPSSKELNCSWSNVVKLGQSLYREAPGMDVYRPSQDTPVKNLFLAGSYTYQDYIDSMEGAVKSGRLAATAVLNELIARNAK